ncbi:MAG: hypothetical protein ACAI43_18215 [Phycisphaerae bacterium]|nr:hypothetical protein [Tepidisphaeraceae bacterium]
MPTRIRPGALAASALAFCALFAPVALAADDKPASRPSKAEARNAVDDKETSAELLGQRSSDVINHAKDRMSDSAQRLGRRYDPGAQTQEIQDRIVKDLDELIELARKQKEAEKKNPPKDPCGPCLPTDPKSNPAGQQPVGPPTVTDAKSPAGQSATSPGNPASTARSDFQERGEVFLRVSPRTRDAVIEGSTEKAPDKYAKLTEAYYRGVAQAGK